MLKVKLDDDVVNYIRSKSNLIEDKTIGVYFLKFNGVVVYVGKSNNIKKRINTHSTEGLKVFNDFSFIECSKNTLESTEVSYIMMHDPVFNKRDSLTCGGSLEEFYNKNNVSCLLYEHKQKKFPVTLSLDESIIEMAKEIIESKHFITKDTFARNFSHLVETLILKDYANFKRGKKR